MFSHSTAIMICTFAAASAGAYAVFTLFDPYGLTLRRKMRSLPGGRFEREEDVASPHEVASLLKRFADIGADREADRKRIIERLANAGIYHPSAASWFFSAKLLLLTIPIAAMVIASTTGWIVWEPAVAAGLATAAIASLAPNAWLTKAINRRHHSLRRALPDLLDLMIICLEGGLSLPETVRRVAEELQIAHPDLATELGLVQRDIDLGSTIDQALRRFAMRSNFEGVRTLATFVREAQRFGTKLTEALRNHADMLRSQREQSAEEQARQASVKILMPMMLLILPAIFVVLVAPAVIQIHEAFAGK